MPETLRFGIESLDRLIGSKGDDFGLSIARGGEESDDDDATANGDGAKKLHNDYVTTSICITGPDGTGKSVLALHLAARYMADCREERDTPPEDGPHDPLPTVLYVSTDLTHSMARKVWNNFGLPHPSLREEPFNINEPRRRAEKGLRPVTEPLPLLGQSPGDVGRVLSSSGNYAIHFVDLAQMTAGDDWGFVHRLLSVMDRREGGPRDLVLLDAVEGFETLVGDINAFGDKSTRRSRIAQVMRLAADKCHLLFVVEESKEERLPEEFVTDSVIRLRNIEINGYIRRTIEVEKTRGQTHVRGQHPFVIRDGSGSTTGNEKYKNHDDPRVLKDGARGDGRTQSYVQVFPSINNLSRVLMEQRGDPKMEPPKGKYAAFGIPYLDTILGGDGELGVQNGHRADTRGLPCSSVTALIGDALTSKGLLGRAFLSRTFYAFACELAGRTERRGWGSRLRSADNADKATLSRFGHDLREIANEIKGEAAREMERVRTAQGGREEEKPSASGLIPGVALMMTTQDTHVEELANEFIRWLNPNDLLGIRDEGSDKFSNEFAVVLKEHIIEHTICRRMEVHDISSPVLAHIFRRNIQAAQMKLFGIDNLKHLPEAVSHRHRESWRIRMVIDDFNAFRSTFPDIHNDPLLLPFLLLQFGREGISTLVIDTQSGKPDIALAERFESSLREAANYRLYTWRIPFYGETRIAITAIPPISMKSRGLIRELSGQGMQAHMHSEDEREDRQLTVDPHFELYAGLERGLPHPVPLEVRLYPGTETLVRYIQEENVFFRELFVPNSPKTEVIVGFDPPHYESLREFCYLQRDTRLDHTLVFQVDEFWLTWLTRQSLTRKGGVLQRQWPYLDTVTVDRNGQPDPAADAYHLFQETFDDVRAHNNSTAQAETSAPQSLRVRRRRHFYDDERLEYGFGGDLGEDDKKEFSGVDRVPFLWDFAFLLCRENLWKEYITDESPEARALKHNGHGREPDDKSSKYRNVKWVWESIPKAKEDGFGGEHVSWYDFLRACKEVAEYHSARTATDIPAFDFSMNDGESFSCLLLELWASETYKCRKDLASEVKARNFARRLSQKKWNRRPVNERMSLLQGLIGDRDYTLGELLWRRKHEDTAADKVTGYSLELYRAWLLLTEVTNFSELVRTPDNFSFEFTSRQSNPQAVAAHHWYQSACDLIDQNRLSESTVAVRLPGHFSVRGDWFLAAAGGSRSGRLAHRAFDLLSSRRANIKRLQLGIGLPVRKIASDEEDFKHVRTRLISTDHETGRLDNVSYKDFLKIKGKSLKGSVGHETGDEFYWLWRSSIYGYARYSRVWQKWLNRTAIWWNTIYTRHKTGWTPGFEVYKRIEEYMYDGAGKTDADMEKLRAFDEYESWRLFHRFRNILLTELQQVSFGSR